MMSWSRRMPALSQRVSILSVRRLQAGHARRRMLTAAQAVRVFAQLNIGRYGF